MINMFKHTLLAASLMVTAAHANHTVTFKEDPKSVDYFIHYADQILVGKIEQVSSTNLTIHVVKVFKGSPEKEFSLRIKPTISKTLNAFDESSEILFFIDSESRMASLFAEENGLMPLIKIKNRTYASFHSGTIMPTTPDDTRFFVPNPIPCDEYEQCFSYLVLEAYIPAYMIQLEKSLTTKKTEKQKQYNIPNHVLQPTLKTPVESGKVQGTAAEL